MHQPPAHLQGPPGISPSWSSSPSGQSPYGSRQSPSTSNIWGMPGGGGAAGGAPAAAGGNTWGPPAPSPYAARPAFPQSQWQQQTYPAP
jgi:hypothetical protein